MTLQANGRAMSTNALTITIPSTPPTSTGPDRKYIIKTSGDLVAQDEDNSDLETEASSICQSPGWDDLSGKKRRKEKEEAKERRRKEREKAEVKAKAGLTPKKKLNKAPPSAHARHSQALTDRSLSDSETPARPGSKDGGKLFGRSRRNSLEIVKNFISETIPGWKSSGSSPAVPTANGSISSDQQPTRPSFSKSHTVSAPVDGFIGGLKLRQAEESAIQETIRRQSLTYPSTASPSHGGDNSKIGDVSNEENSPDGSIQTSIYDESQRSLQQWDMIYVKAAKAIVQEPEPTPIMERNIRKSQITHPPTLPSKYFPNIPNQTTYDPSLASTRNSSIMSSQQSVREMPSSELSSLDVNFHNNTEEPRGRYSRSYGRDQYMNEDHSYARSGHERQASEATTNSKKESKSRGISFRTSRSRAHGQETNMVRSDTRDNSASDIKLSSNQEIGTAHSIFSEEYYKMPLHNSQVESPPRSEKGHKKGSKSSSGAPSNFWGFRSVAKAAFSRNSVNLDSPTESFASSNSDTPATQRPLFNKRANTVDVDQNGPLRTSEQVLGERLPKAVVVNGEPPASSDHACQFNFALEHAEPTSSVSSNGSHGWNQPMSFTDSSEEYSTADGFSNITTPTASRPQSQKGYSPSSIEEFNLKALQDEFRESAATLKSSPRMSGALTFDDAASNRDSWCRTAVEIELTEDEERMRTPTARKLTDFTTPPLPERSPDRKNGHRSQSPEASLQRESSLSRSFSTPQIITTPNNQDLSFLPALKHQPLTRPQKEKKSSNKKGKQSASREASRERSTSPSSRSIIRSPPPPLPNGKFEPTPTPLPSQYLQAARLNIPRPTSSSSRSSPKTSTPSQIPNPHLQASQEPIAKMFVVCCSCRYFHDMPSKIYECMAKPDNVVTDTHLGVSGIISTSVKCPWCGHGMSTACCAGYAAVVVLRERLH